MRTMQRKAAWREATRWEDERWRISCVSSMHVLCRNNIVYISNTHNLFVVPDGEAIRGRTRKQMEQTSRAVSFEEE